MPALALSPRRPALASPRNAPRPASPMSAPPPAAAAARQRRKGSRPDAPCRSTRVAADASNGSAHTASAAAGAKLDGEAVPQGESCPLPAAASSWAKREPPLGGRMVWRLLRQQKRHLLLAGVSLVLCVSMNLASPVLQGMLFDVLVRGQPFQQ